MASPQWTTTPQKVLPSAATAVSVTPSATPWANSAWVELSAATSAAWVITGLSVVPDPGTFGVGRANVSFEVDLGVGGEGAEVVRTTFRGHYGNTFYNGPGYLPCALPVDNVANGVRLAIRMRKSTTTTDVWKYAVTYLVKALVGDLQVTAKPQKVAPPAASPVTIAVPVTQWTSSAYSTVIASAAADLVLVGIVCHNTYVNNYEIDLAVGAVASEAVITTFRAYNWQITNPDGPGFTPFRFGLNAIPSGSRVSARVRGTGASLSFGLSQVDLALVYVEQPV